MKQPHDEFATKLRDEAERETPEFSDELHTRVMAAVRREKVRAAGSLSLRRLLVVPVGAGLAVLVSVVVWMVQPSSPPVPSPLVELPTVPALDEVIRETTGPVQPDPLRIHASRISIAMASVSRNSSGAASP